MASQRSWFDLAVVASLILVLLLQIYPLPPELKAWRPHFVLMLCCYLTASRVIPLSLEFACLAGLLTDLVSGNTLGIHALAITFSVALFRILHSRLRHGGLFPELLVVALLTVLTELIIQSLNLMSRDMVYTDWVLYPALSALVLWLPVRIVLGRLVPPPLD